MLKAHSHQARLRPSTVVDGRKRAWCERARFLTCVRYRRRRAWCEWALSLSCHAGQQQVRLGPCVTMGSYSF